MVGRRRFDPQSGNKPVPPPIHNPAVDRQRIENLLDINGLLQDAAPNIASLALSQAIELSLDKNIPMGNIVTARYFKD